MEMRHFVASPAEFRAAQTRYLCVPDKETPPGLDGVGRSVS
jgi:hypothetical protein